uniref:Uncharacterized protein n=1 Tax=Rhizophora mucronata TaxID=61149 RepID=A0A2P2LMI2_RHIMU
MASCLTWSLLIFPVVVSGNGFLHSMITFGTLNLQKDGNALVTHQTFVQKKTKKEENASLNTNASF